VYQVLGDSLAVSRIIEVKDHVGNLVVVQSGIRAGDKIVAEGIGKLHDKTPVIPKPVAFDSVANSLNTVFK
jgi:membrane fusion protein (multidrug efflux system)